MTAVRPTPEVNGGVLGWVRTFGTAEQGTGLGRSTAIDTDGDGEMEKRQGAIAGARVGRAARTAESRYVVRSMWGPTPRYRLGHTASVDERSGCCQHWGSTIRSHLRPGSKAGRVLIVGAALVPLSES